MADAAIGAADAAAPKPREITPGYRRFALTLLVLIYTVNFLDRQVVTQLIEPIKKDLQLTDTQVGAMGGFYFAILYTVLGIPIARLADKGDRPLILSVSLFIWSGFTVAAGFAWNFITLAISRMGVGVGEAGCTPTAHSLISEYFPKEKRARAISIYSMGISIGSLLGMALGALIADVYGWRYAFFVAGAPGLILGAISLFTLIEPRRKLKGSSAPTAAALAAKSAYLPVSQVAKLLFTKPTFWLFAFGGAFAASVSYSHSFYLTGFFLRNHYNDLLPVAAQFGLKPLGFLGLATGIAAGIGGVIGSYLGGWWCDKFGAKDARHFALPPIVYPFIGLPIFWYLCSINDMMLAMILLIPVNVGVAIWYGPVYGGVPGLVPPAMRATASAMVLFIVNMLGLGLAPMLFGMLSDYQAGLHLAPNGLDVAACKGVTEGMPNYATCASASALGLKDAIYLSTGVHALGILCFIGALFTIRKDMES